MNESFLPGDKIETPQLKLAQEFIKFTGANIFLTGKAGTGKTTFLHKIKNNSHKRLIITAPTGVAAINAGGVTIHSFFQLPFGPQIIQKVDAGGTSDKQIDMNKFNRDKLNIIRSLDLLVIDEISMVRADLLDAVDRVLRRYKNRYKPFGGVQLLMIGDLQQLAPIVKDEDWEILKHYYDTPFFFSSQALKKTQFVCIELQHIFRQSDAKFINLLNKVRENRLDKDSLAMLNERFNPDFDIDKEKGYITLTTHNKQAEKINFIQMSKINEPSNIFSAEISGLFPEYSFPNESELVLKPGAQVMFVKNDTSKEKRYYNGKIGKITSIDDGFVYVICEGDDEEIVVEPVEWHNYSYTIDEKTEEIIENLLGTYKQIPLKPAWAITIHKSQGLTFEKAVIDANLAFAHGQVYVALSRCRNLEGMVLSSKIDPKCLRTDNSVLDFLNELEGNQPDEKKLAEYRRDFEFSLLAELNDFSTIQRRLEYCKKLVLENENVLQGKPIEICNETIIKIKTEIIDVSQKFYIQINRLFIQNPDVENNELLQERLIKATSYYKDKLNQIFELFFEMFVLETDNKAIKKSIKDSVERLDDEFRYKCACLETVGNGFLVSAYLESRSKASLVKAPVKKLSKKEKSALDEDSKQISRTIRAAEDVASSDIIRPDLYKLLKSWRNQKAAESNHPVYLIISQKSMVEMSNLLPKNLTQLRKINGIGDKKIHQFGNELLLIISEYIQNNFES